ncbi:alpha/beta hydrolase [Saccharopolyspora cebuensis]|uniref:Alpha/beta hydrolase fold domain-containing protein n=1 Tax=Saccharopolyspora cebuensis TaxID=418759 RepID=A0ABV4CN30_9PSEU
MLRRLVALCAGLAVLVATGCSRASSADVPAPRTAAADLGAAEVVRGAVYAERDSGPLALDLFLPEASGEPVPLVVYAHGGGWDAGERTLDADRRTAEALAAEQLLARGYAVATVDYRLTTVAPAPAQVVDVSDAVRWLQRNADRWGLDPDRVALWGASAGGHLVAQLGVATDDPAAPGGGLTGIRAVLDWFGPTDLSAEAQAKYTELTPYAEKVIVRLLGCLPAECPERAAAASPIEGVSGAEPPFLIQQGTADSLVPLEQSLDFAAELRRRGTTVQLHPYEGVDHGFGRGRQAELAVDALIAFVETHV